jgi:hypothetical protein
MNAFFFLVCTMTNANHFPWLADPCNCCITLHHGHQGDKDKSIKLPVIHKKLKLIGKNKFNYLINILTLLTCGLKLFQTPM